MSLMISDPLVAEQVNELRARQFAAAAEIEAAHRELDQLGVQRRDLFMVPFSLSGRIALLQIEMETRSLAAQEIKVDALIAHSTLAVLEHQCRKLQLELAVLRAPDRFKRFAHRMARRLARG